MIICGDKAFIASPAFSGPNQARARTTSPAALNDRIAENGAITIGFDLYCASNRQRSFCYARFVRY
jgi:hypothetical protein